MACLGFEETELRLGLPRGGTDAEDAGVTVRSSGKRGFAETIDLKLKLEPASASAAAPTAGDEEVAHGVAAAKQQPSPAAAAACNGQMKRSPSQSSVVTSDPEKPRAPKAQAVGWPPVRSFRKNILAVQADKSAAALVKVSVDGAPYLRKVDIGACKSYGELSKALEKMLSSFTMAGGSQGIMKGMNDESKLADLLSGSDYVPTYEDKDGDWMLVGDVPWEMFVASCKRLRIMKGSEAIGLAPRAMEKCRSRS
ncbi:hypothetical protein ACQ4PT_016439 [Festuca glaucescens]